MKVCILSDQTDIILDLREKLSKASQDREELQDSLMEVEHLFNSSESQRKDIADNLEWRFQREMQLNTKIKSLEGVNSKLRHALEMEEEEEKDSSSSDSEGESGVEEEDEEVGVEDEYREKAEQKKETYVAAAHTVQAVIKKGKTRDGDLGIADVAYREERISSTQTNHSPHSIKPVSSPSSSSSSSGLGKRLRLSSRKELKEWVIRLTDEQHRFHQSCEVDKNTKAELVKAFQVTIEEQRAEVLRCTSVAKEAVTGMEEAAKKLLCKENENIRIAHSVVSVFTCEQSAHIQLDQLHLVLILCFHTVFSTHPSFLPTFFLTFLLSFFLYFLHSVFILFFSSHLLPFSLPSSLPSYLPDFLIRLLPN